MAATTPSLARTQTQALRELAAFPLVEALFGRRSRRFALGDQIPDGPLAYRSRHQPVPLTELERMLVLSAMGGTTGWHYSITPPSCSSPTTRGCTSSRHVTPARWSTRPPTR
jgi:hypothetical protein